MSHASDTFEATASAFKRGEVAVFPTETVYGVGVAVACAPSPDVLFEVKRREKRKPISWLVSERDDLLRYGAGVPEFARVLARTFWPGPLTLVVKASSLVPSAFMSSAGTIGLRMPNSDCALSLIKAVGCPLATTSANVSGLSPTCSFDELDEQILSQVAAVLSDGDDSAKSGVSSTVVDCTGDHPQIMREGAITIADIRALS